MKIDFNKRIDLFLNKYTDISSDRISTIALPFLSLNETTSTLTSAGVGIYQTYQHSTNLITSYKKGAVDRQEMVQLAMVISSTALAIFFPLGRFVLSNGIQFCTHLSELSHHLQQRNWVQCHLVALKIAHQSVYIASVYYGTPAWLACSLLSQAFCELYQAYQFANDPNGRLYEAYASVLLAGIRFYKAGSHIENLYKAYNSKQPAQEAEDLNTSQSQSKPESSDSKTTTPDEQPTQNQNGASTPVKETAELKQEEPIFTEQQPVQNKIPEKPLTQEEWDNLYWRIRWESQDIGSTLAQRGISRHIEGIDFRESPDFDGFIFKNLYLKNCNFSKLEFYKTRFESVTADSCIFKNTLWINSIVSNTIFKNCNMENAVFFNSFLKTVSFFECNLKQTCFNGSSLSGPSIVRSTLAETSFLDARVEQGSLINCDLTDALLLDAKENFQIQGGTEHRMTRPVVAIGCDFEWEGTYRPLMEKALQAHGAILLRYDQEGDSFDTQQLNGEIRTAIEQLKLSVVPSIPQALLLQAQEGSAIIKIQNKAAAILKYSQGLAIPGGEDIEPEFYGASPLAEEFSQSRYRTILELALLQRAKEKETPTIGICRGSQIINVFFGGTLHQHVKGQHGYHSLEFTDSPHGDSFRQAMDNDLIGLSLHHQAADKIGQGLHVILKYGSVPKLMVSEDGTFIACQIHPEDYLSVQEEKAFYEKFKNIDIAAWLRTLIYNFFKKKAYDKKRDIDAIVDKLKPKVLQYFLMSPIEDPEGFIKKNKMIYALYLERVCSYKSKTEAAIEEKQLPVSEAYALAPASTQEYNLPQEIILEAAL